MFADPTPPRVGTPRRELWRLKMPYRLRTSPGQKRGRQVATLVTALLGAVLAAPSGAVAADDWSSYGHDLANSRSQSQPAGIGAGTAPRLVERWARRHVGPVDGTTYSVTGTPAVTGRTVS